MLCLKCWTKKFRPVFKELLNFLFKKLSLSSEKYGFGIRDPRSGIRKKPIPDPRFRIQGSKRHRIPDPNPQHRVKWFLCIFERRPHLKIPTVALPRIENFLVPYLLPTIFRYISQEYKSAFRIWTIRYIPPCIIRDFHGLDTERCFGSGWA
jgi:hypothetical protein